MTVDEALMESEAFIEAHRERTLAQFREAGASPEEIAAVQEILDQDADTHRAKRDAWIAALPVRPATAAIH